MYLSNNLRTYNVTQHAQSVYFIFRVLLQVDHVGVLNILALFVIIGVGVDGMQDINMRCVVLKGSLDLFVFFNMFQHYENINDVEVRLAQTIKHAAKATFSMDINILFSYDSNLWL